MSNAGAASLAALIPARAAASRRNGAKSRGPKTPEGKARSAQNALKHGLRARHFVVIGDEDMAEFQALEAALMAELAPQGALQTVLGRRIVAATWRLERAERIEAELLAHNMRDTTSFGLALIRDCNGARAFDTLLRYRGGTLAELWRALRTLKELQVEARAQAAEDAAAHQEPAARPAEAQPGESQAQMPSKPEARRIPGESAAAAAAQGRTDGPHDTAAGQAEQMTSSAQGWRAPVREEYPSEPESRKNPGDPATRVSPPAISWPRPVAA